MSTPSARSAGTSRGMRQHLFKAQENDLSIFKNVEPSRHLRGEVKGELEIGKNADRKRYASVACPTSAASLMIVHMYGNKLRFVSSIMYKNEMRSVSSIGYKNESVNSIMRAEMSEFKRFNSNFNDKFRI